MGRSVPALCPGARALGPVAAMALLLLGESFAAEPHCAGDVFAVVGPPLLSDRLGADAIRVGAGTVAIRSGCDEAPVEVHVTREGDAVLRGFFHHCAVDAETVSVWLRVRADCSALVGRVGLLPRRRVRVFEGVRTSEEAAAWPRTLACEPPREEASCERAPRPPSGGRASSEPPR